MTKISKVFNGILIEDSLDNYLNKVNVSICQLLFFPDISDIAKYVEQQFYTDKDWHFIYEVAAMIKFAIVKIWDQFLLGHNNKNLMGNCWVESEEESSIVGR